MLIPLGMVLPREQETKKRQRFPSLAFCIVQDSHVKAISCLKHLSIRPSKLINGEDDGMVFVATSV